MTSLRRVLNVLICLSFLPTSILAQDAIPTSQRSSSQSPPVGSFQKVASTIRTVPLRAVQDFKLTILLDALDRSYRIVPKDSSAFHLAYETPVVVIPLSNLQDPQKSLYMYYLPEKELYFFLQVSYNKDGKEEARLWTNGSAEILLSEDAMVFLPAQSESTFRIPEDVEQMAATTSKIGPSSLSPFDVLACIARVIGVSFDPSSLINKIASVSCSTLNVVNLVVLACDCLSIPSVGAGAVFGTIGCISGIGAYIACGVVNCSNQQQPAANLQVSFSPNPAVARASCASGRQYNFTIILREVNGVGLAVNRVDVDQFQNISPGALGIPSHINANAQVSSGISYCRGTGVSTWTIYGTDDHGRSNTWRGSITLR
jgi:hypothetical protein